MKIFTYVQNLNKSIIWASLSLLVKSNMMVTKKKSVIASFPPPYPENPYLNLLYGSLKKHDFELVSDNAFSIGWFFKNRKGVDIIHFHWLEYFYKDLFSFILLIAKLIVVKIFGYKIVWTVHNIFPHERKFRKLSYLAVWTMLLFSNKVIAHCNYSKNRITNKFYNKKNIFVIPHGNYIGWYPNSVDRAEAIRKLGLAESSFIFLYFGLIRKYKGLELLIESFEKLDSNDVLLIAGKPIDEEMKERLEILTKDANNICTHLRFIPDEEVQYFFNATDVVVLPFRDVLTSGSLLLAMSFGKPVIASNQGCISETVDEEIGILVDMGNVDNLVEGLKDIKNKDLKKAQEKSFKRAKELDWEKISEKYIKIYRKP